MGALDDELFGMRDSMRRGIERLRRARLLSESDSRKAMTISLFGDFIGNTDQHFGNLSFSYDDNGLRLGPIYDVLPMFYAPRSGGEILKDKLHTQPVYLPEEGDLFGLAREMALQYWSRLRDDTALSDNFRDIAAKCAARI